MKLQIPLTLLTLLLTTTVSATTATKPTIDVHGKADADADHKGKEKPKPKEKFCKIVGKKNADAVKCVAEPQLMAQSVATVQSGAEYKLPCFEEQGSCLFNHCEWYKLDWEGGSCYVNGYYTDCDKEKHVKCKAKKEE